MTDEIINRVALSKLMVIDLEDYYPEGKRVLFDLKDWLYEGLVLREKDFRERIKTHDWSLYKDSFVALSCSSDAIIPAWAYTLISIHVSEYSKEIYLGSLDDLESSLFKDIIDRLDLEPYRDKPIILKGCANKPVPINAYIQLATRLKPIAKSIMYGEACSSVPLFKKKKV